jgi:hypothetical protein
MSPRSSQASPQRPARRLIQIRCTGCSALAAILLLLARDGLELSILLFTFYFLHFNSEVWGSVSDGAWAETVIPAALPTPNDGQASYSLLPTDNRNISRPLDRVPCRASNGGAPNTPALSPPRGPHETIYAAASQCPLQAKVSLALRDSPFEPLMSLAKQHSIACRC